MCTSRLLRQERPLGLRIVLLAAGALLALTGAARGEWLNVDCSGATAGALTSITAALNSLTEPPPTGGHHYIILLGDCTENVTISGRHNVWIAPAWASSPGPLDPGEEPARIVGSIEIFGSEVTLVHLALVGGEGHEGGLSIRGSSYVWTYGVSAEGTSGPGFAVSESSHVEMFNGRSVGNVGFGIAVSYGATAQLWGMVSWWGDPRPFEISDNGEGGILVTRGVLAAKGGMVIANNGGPGLLSHGGDTDFGELGVESTIEGNQIGAILREGSEATFWNRIVFRDNGPIGVLAEEGSHLTLAGCVSPAPGHPCPVVVEGHTQAGVHVRSNSQASFSGHTIVRANGSAGDASSGGIRVTGDSQAYFGPKEPEFVPVSEQGAEVTANLGAGIMVDIDSTLDLRGATISDNAGEGLRVHHMSLIEVDPECQVFGNAGGPLTCDDTSLVLSEVLEKNIHCKNVIKGKL